MLLTGRCDCRSVHHIPCDDFQKSLSHIHISVSDFVKICFACIYKFFLNRDSQTIPPFIPSNVETRNNHIFPLLSSLSPHYMNYTIILRCFQYWLFFLFGVGKSSYIALNNSVKYSLLSTSSIKIIFFAPS